VDSRVTRCSERGPRPRAEQGVLADQRPVEVAGEGLDGGRKIRRKI
jgi:hypothetical protein